MNCKLIVDQLQEAIIVYWQDGYRMKKKETKQTFFLRAAMMVLTTILIVLFFAIMSMVGKIQGTARVINYAGLVRGGTQRMVKLEISGTPQDKMYQTTSSYIEGLRNGSDELNFIRLDDQKFQSKMDELAGYFEELRDEILLVREKGYENTDIIEKSEHFFQICDEAVGLSEAYSQRKATALDYLEKVVIVDILGLVLIIGATYGAVSAFAGGWVDNIMMRITDILYTIPDILLIILLGMALKDPLDKLSTQPGFKWMQTLGPNMISIFIIFALLYWVGMARIVRSQILILKESEYVTAARALGASSGRIIKKHLLTNCIGTLIVSTTLQIPSSIFTESYLSFIGLGVAAPLPSLGSLATDAVKGMNTYPHLLIAPALMISVMILVFNLFGDGLRDAFDPKLKN